MPLGVRRYAEPGALLCDVDAERHTNVLDRGVVSDSAGGEVSRCPVLGLVAHLSPAMRAAGGENASEWPGAVRQIWKSSLRLSVCIPIPLQGLNGREVKRVSACRFSLEGQQDHLAAGSVPALVLAQDERHDPVPVVLVPPELPAERTRDEISDTEGEPVDMHVSGRAALLILPEAGPERRQVPIGLAPILLQSRRLMRNKPEGANARSGKALLALSVGLLTLELNLSLKGDGPGLARAAAQHVSAPVLAIGRLARLLGQSIPARRAGSDQALGFEVEMQIAFSAALGRMPGRVSKEPGAQSRDLGDRASSASGHPRVALAL